MYVSGIRVGAFVTLPLCAIDIEQMTVRQDPALGVKTKNGKYATTTLLDIPELIESINQWDAEVRLVLPGHGYWFAPLSPVTGEINPTPQNIGHYRDARLRKDLRHWMDSVGLKYHSPHKFRHGHAVYAINKARNFADAKAISQNMMHANVSVTDGIYGGLKEEDVRSRILRLGKTPASATDDTNIDALANMVAGKLIDKLDQIVVQQKT
jgi:integrase